MVIKNTEDNTENKDNTMQEKRKFDLEGQLEVSKMLTIKNTLRSE